MAKGLNQCPVEFSINKEYSSGDIRFVDVTIDIMHTGENRNMCSFDKGVIDAALPTLKNIPILGYVERAFEDDTDFKGHEHELVVVDDDVRYVYSGKAYGVIPESCNPRWVVKDDGTGKEREYLRADGILWTKFDECCDIFARDGQKNHSVELVNMAGKVNERGYYVVSGFEFDGCCILSTTDPAIQPAMTGSTITAAGNFCANTIAGEIKAKLDEYQIAKYNCESMEGKQEFAVKGEIVMDEIIEVMNEQNPEAAAAEPTVEMGEIAEPEIAEAEVEAAAEQTEQQEAESTETETAQQEEEPAEQETVSDEFALDTVQKLNEIERELDKERAVTAWGDEVCIYYICEVTDADVIAIDSRDGKVYGIPYGMNGDNVVIEYEKKRRMKCTYVEWDEGTSELALPPMVESMNELASEYCEIKAKYEEILPKYNAYVEAEETARCELEKQKRENLFEMMDERLGDCAEYEALKLNGEMAYEDLEKECYALVGKKNVEFSYVPSAEGSGAGVVRFGVHGSQKKATGKYGDLFEKFLN